jgi:LuxR family maltose regulon positive regulatory protein
MPVVSGKWSDHHAIAGQDFEQAASLIGNIAENYLMVGRATTLLGWLETLPIQMVLRQPVLAPLKGFALILCNRPLQEAIDLLQQISSTDSLSEYQGEVKTLHAFLAILQGRSTEAIHLSELAMQQLPPGRVFFRSLAADSLGMGHTLAGDFAAAAQAFEQVVEISLQSGNFMMEIMALTNLAGLRYIQGQLRAGISTCRQAMELANHRFGRLTPMLGKTLLNLGEMLREQGDLSAAFQFLSDAARLMDDFTEIGLPVAYLSLAKLKINQKDWQSAQQYIDQARQRARETRSTQMDDQLVEIAQARLWIRSGDLAKATLWARDRGILDRSPAELIGEMSRNAAISEISQVELLNLARLYMEKQQPGQALELLDALDQSNEQRNMNRRPLEFLVLKALALHQMHETDPALEFLHKALLLGEPEGYLTTFVDEGQPMAQLLYQAMAQNICPVYSGRLLKVLSETDPVSSSTQGKNRDLIEPLSQRELEVLGLIVEGLSNAEIASTLYISLSTVKGHTTNIYGKLGIKNRTQAVVQARKFGLITAGKDQAGLF